MGKNIQPAASESGKPLAGTAEHLLYPPASYYDCSSPFYSLRKAWGATRSAPSPFFAILTVKQIVAYDEHKCRVPWPPSFSLRPVRLSVQFKSTVDDVSMWGTIFGAVFAWKEVAIGSEVLVRASFNIWQGEVQLSGIDLLPDEYRGKVIPRYNANRRLGAKNQLHGKIQDALLHAKQVAVATILQRAQTDERSLIQAAGIPFFSLSAVLEAMHAPVSGQEGLDAIVAAKKLSVAALKLSHDRFIRRPSAPKSVISNLLPKAKVWASRLPFPLTADQNAAIAEICADLGHHQPMLRLLSGDVGTGKTATYLLPALAAQESGFRVGILIPNTIVASQVDRELAELAPAVPRLLLKGGSAKMKIEGNPIVVGTTAMLSHLKAYPLDFLVCDEQHKLSDAQRSKLVHGHTNVLEATATAVPRTAALVAYGAMDVSILRQCPYEKRIETQLIAADKEARLAVMHQLNEICATGSQVAVVYPRLESTERGRGAEDAATLWEKRFPGMVVTLHGKMGDEEKLQAVGLMRSGRASVLVATTVIEVGITLPSLKAILIADPDLLGLAQLHQLRGRVARHGGEGFCFLVPSRELEEETYARLRLLEQYSSGFELQEADLANRGFGDLLSGDSQTGNSSILFTGISLRPADLSDDA